MHGDMLDAEQVQLRLPPPAAAAAAKYTTMTTTLQQ